MLEINSDNLVNGNEIYQKIESNDKNYSRWLNRKIDYADLKEGIDFFPKVDKSTGGRPSIDYMFTIDAAKEVCLLERNNKGKELRRWLIGLSNKYETARLFSTEQINFLLELVPVMGLFSVQDDVKKKHFEVHNNRYNWWEYRANILGYGTTQLRAEIEKLNRKYKSQRQALIHVDKYELIRIGIIDLFVALGKTPEYASNVADLCKNMAKKMKVDVYDDSPVKNRIPFPKNHDTGLENNIKKGELKLK